LLGFSDCRVCDLDLSQYRGDYLQWLADNHHGNMHWLETNKNLRLSPQQLVADSLRCLSLSYPYWQGGFDAWDNIEDSSRAYVSRYALGRDYHKKLRKKLAKLGNFIKQLTEDTLQFRPFVDSAPLLEKPLAAKAGIGWVGKNTLVLNKQGSYFFLGEILLNLPLPIDKPMTNECGKCKACLKVCPTDAFVNPYKLNANKCISYLTIEHHGTIDIQFRKAMGNRIFGCDDCQLICPWNRYAKHSEDPDFKPRHNLDNSSIIDLFLWSEQQFDHNTKGSPIRRVGYHRWLRNVSIALGNGPKDLRAISSLQYRLKQFENDAVLTEHFAWALEQLQ